MPGRRLNKWERREILAEYPDVNTDGLTEKQRAKLVEQMTTPVNFESVEQRAERIRQQILQSDRDAMGVDWKIVGDDLRKAMGLKAKPKPKRRK